MIQASTWYMLAETSGSARGDFLVSFGGYSVCVRAIVAYNSSSLYILSNNISANTLISFRIRKLVSKQYVDIKVNKELDIAYSIDNNNNWTTLFGLSGIGQEICALNNINGDYSETGNVDYEDLLNKPSINGVTLIGDKKASDLNLQPAGDYADKQFETLFKKFFEYDEFHNAIKARLDFYTDADKNISAGGYNNTGEIVAISSYSELKDKPFINGQELVPGNNSLDKLGIQPKGNYTTNEFVESLTNTIIEKLNLHISDFEDFVGKFNTYFEFDSKNQAIKVLLDLYTDTGKNISASGYNNSGTEIIVPKSYNELTEKPQINGQELLSGDNSLDKLGIQPKGNYTTNEFVESLTNTIIEKLNLHISDFEDFVGKFNTYFEFDSKNQAIKVLLDLYTDTGKNISASGYNNSGTEIIVPKSYNELTEKPQINGQELLSGDNSLDKLGIQPKGNYATNEIVESQISAIIERLNSHITDFETFVNELNTYFQFDSKNQAIKVLYDLYTDKGKNISASGYNNSGTEIIIPTSYPDLIDKPTINGIELVGNLTSKDLGLQLEGDYLTTSDIFNTVKQEDGTTKQYVKSELLPEVKGGDGIEVLQTISKTNISLLADNNTFSFGETNELQINKIDGGVF